jgi:glycolate oxidase
VKDKLFESLSEIVGSENVTIDPTDLYCYSFDAFSYPFIDKKLFKFRPTAVVMPTTTEQVSKIVKFAYENRIPVIPKGAGTSISGGSIPTQGGIIVDLTRMNKIKKIDVENLLVVVEPGIIDDDLNLALKSYGFFFPPDPGSHEYCTVGGMVANNAGGMRAIKYGATRDHVKSLEVVLPDGRIIRTSPSVLKISSGYSLTQLFVGSEGTLGIITEITLKLTPLPEHRTLVVIAFKDLEDAGRCVSEIRKSGIIPSSLELVERYGIKTINEILKGNIPEADALLFAEFDGSFDEAVRQAKRAEEIIKKYEIAYIRFIDDENEIERFFKARQGAAIRYIKLVPELARIGMGEDFVVPVSAVPKALKKAREIFEKKGIKVMLVSHIGDGNIHPFIMIDLTKKEEQWQKILEAAREVNNMAIELGGTSSGEHGVGISRREFLPKEYGEAVEVMKAIKRAIDPENIMNPGKIFE